MRAHCSVSSLQQLRSARWGHRLLLGGLFLNADHMAALVALVGGLNTFDLIYAMTKGGPLYQTETMALEMYRLTALKDVYDPEIPVNIYELGLIYRLAPIVFMGGSLVPHGGQNPIEPAKLGAAILHGLRAFNEATVGATERVSLAVLVRDGELVVEAWPEPEKLLPVTV